MDNIGAQLSPPMQFVVSVQSVRRIFIAQGSGTVENYTDPNTGQLTDENQSILYGPPLTDRDMQLSRCPRVFGKDAMTIGRLGLVVGCQ